NQDRVISVLDETGLFHSVFENSEHIKYAYLTDINLENAKDLVSSKDEYGLLYIKKSPDSTKIFESSRFYSADSPSLTIISGLEDKIEKKLTDLKLIQDGVDIEKIRASR